MVTIGKQASVMAENVGLSKVVPNYETFTLPYSMSIGSTSYNNVSIDWNYLYNAYILITVVITDIFTDTHNLY